MTSETEGKRFCGRPSVTPDEVVELVKRYPGRFVKLRDSAREEFLAEPIETVKGGRFVTFRVFGVIVDPATVAPILWPGEEPAEPWADNPDAGVAIIRRFPEGD